MAVAARALLLILFAAELEHWMATELFPMHSVLRSGRRKTLHTALGILLLLGACDRTTNCCPENVTVSHALIYGVVRSPDGSGVAGALVQSAIAGQSVMTANGGAYRLPIPLPLFSPGARRISVNVFPPNYRPGLDSVTRVSLTVQSFATERVADSTRVDVTLPGAP